MRKEIKPDTGRAGVVLAGGYATRFGGDEATTPLAGRPIIRHVVENVAPAVDELVINCASDRRRNVEAALDEFANPAGAPVRFVEDPMPARGPIVGLRAALDATTAEYAGVVPGDAPLIPAAFLSALFDYARNRSGAVPTVDGRPRPLPAVVHVRAATAACSATIARRTDRLRDLMDQLDPRVMPEREVRAHVDPTAFLTVETPADRRIAAARLGARPARE